MPQMVAETPSPDPVMPGDDVPALTEESPDSADATTGSPFLKILSSCHPFRNLASQYPTIQCLYHPFARKNLFPLFVRR